MRKENLALFGVIGLGLILRLFVLAQRGSFWFDEAFAVHFSSMDIPRMLSYLRFENNPSLYFIILHFWMKLFGNSELVVRMLSMIFGVAAIPLIYLIGVRLGGVASESSRKIERGLSAATPNSTGRTIGLFAAFLLAIATFQVFYSTETRMYTMYLFLALLGMLLFLSEKKRRVPLFFVLLLMVWTHITAWMIVAALCGYLLWQSHFSVKQVIIHNAKFISIVALLALSFLPWAINFVQLKIAAPLSQGYLFHIPPDKNFFLSILENFLVFGQDNAFIITLLSAIIVVLLWFAVREIRRQGLRSSGGLASPHALLLCWLFVPLFIGFAFQNAIPRYFIAVAPALYLLMGIGFAQLVDIRNQSLLVARPQRKVVWPLPLLVTILTFALIFPDYPSLIKIGHHEWDKLAEWVQDQDSMTTGQQDNKTIILINPHSEILPFERYYQGRLPVIGFYPKDDDLDRDMRIVRTNWVSLNTKENVSRLADITKEYNQVFLVTGGIDPVGRNLVPVWFWENGWRRGESQEFGKMSVMVLERL